MASLVLFNGASKSNNRQINFNQFLLSPTSSKSRDFLLCNFLFLKKYFKIEKIIFLQKLKPAFWESPVRVHAAERTTQQTNHNGIEH